MGLLGVYSRGRWEDGLQQAVAGSGTGSVSVAVGASPVELNPVMYRGEEREFTFTLDAVDPATGLPLDIRAWVEVWFSVKMSLADADSAVVFRHLKGAGAGTAGVLRVDPDGLNLFNVFRVYVAPADTANATLQPQYEHHPTLDCRALTSTGRVKEIAFGTLTVKPSVTQAVVP